MNITRYGLIVLCGLVCNVSAPNAQAKKTIKKSVKKTVVKKKTVKKAVKKAVAKSNVRYDDGIVIMSGSGSIDVSHDTIRNVRTRDVKISKVVKFTPQMLAAIREQSQRNPDVKIADVKIADVKAADVKVAAIQTRVVAPPTNRTRPPAFNVADTRGSMVTLDQYRGNVLVLDFWATWCPPCVDEAPEMVQLYNKYRVYGMDMVGISLDTDAEALERFTSANKMPWRQIFGGKGWDSDLSRLYKIRSVPCPIVIARDGPVFAFNVRGAELEKAVVGALAER